MQHSTSIFHYKYIVFIINIIIFHKYLTLKLTKEYNHCHAAAAQEVLMAKLNWNQSNHFNQIVDNF